MATDVEIAWAAGVFEGEGCVTLALRPSGRPRVQMYVVSTDRDVLDRFAAVVGAGKVYGPYERAARKPISRWAGGSWALLERLSSEWSPYLSQRRSARFREVLGQRPAPYVTLNLTQRHLTATQVREIRQRTARGEAQHRVAADYDVAQTTVSLIHRRLTYREV
jgi:hypothetical protein